MADLINAPCGIFGANTGDTTCRIEPRFLDSYIWTPFDTELTPAQCATPATIKAALQALLYNSNRALRCYIFKGASTVALGVTEATSETSGYGKARSLLDAQYNLTFTFWNKGTCWYSKAQEFDRAKGRIWLIGTDGVFHAEKMANGNRRGFEECDHLVNAASMATGAAGWMQTHKITFNDYTNDYGKNASYAKIPNLQKDLLGIQDIFINNITSLISPTAPVGTYYIQVLDSCGGSDLAAKNQTYWTTKTQGHPYTSYNNTTGAGTVIPISTAVYTEIPYVGATAGAIALAFDITDTDWVLTDNVFLGLPPTNTLNSDGVIGVEANPSFIVLPN